MAENAAKQRASSWMPQRRHVAEYVTCNAWADVDSLPVEKAELVIPLEAVKGDYATMQAVNACFEAEQEYERRREEYKQRRIHATRQDLARRKMYNDMLEQKAGQPSRNVGQHAEHKVSQRLNELAQPKVEEIDYHKHSDLQGLLHTAHKPVLEVLDERGHFAKRMFPDVKKVPQGSSGEQILAEESTLEMESRSGEAAALMWSNVLSRAKTAVMARPAKSARPQREDTAKSAEAQQSYEEQIPAHSARTIVVQSRPTSAAKRSRPASAAGRVQGSRPGSRASSRPTSAHTTVNVTANICSELDRFESKLSSIRDKHLGNDFKLAPTSTAPLTLRVESTEVTELLEEASVHIPVDNDEEELEVEIS
mmetsp:Transcript_42253/g.103916  ORF Transcript_42253/g.103916 Transcript_42253/m.103916 type:complete len:366 (-) Transcript_42253:205-1302(-)